MKIQTKQTKRLLNLIATLGLVAWGTGYAHAQLVNGGLNAISVGPQVLATPTGWSVTATRSISGAFTDGASSEPWANSSAGDPSGTFGLFFKPFQGNLTDGNLTVNLFQDNPGTPGVSYTLTGWARAEAGYSGLTDPLTTKSQFALEFLDAGSSVIGGSVLDLFTAGLGGTDSSYSVSATAPAGTVGVRSRVSMIDAYGTSGGQAFIVDAFTLVPEPSTFALFGLGFAGLAIMRRRS